MHEYTSSLSFRCWTKWTTLFLVLANISGLAAHSSHGNQFRVHPYRPQNYWVPSPDIIAYAVLELELQQGTSRSAGIIQPLRQGYQIDGVYGAYGDAQLNSTNRGLVFTTSIQVGSKTFQAVVDTGSSDTWLIQKGFQCLAPFTQDRLSEADCNFGPTYTPASTFQKISNENFHVVYTSQEYLTGTYGLETVTVAGITVPKQQIAVVKEAAYNGDGYTSGLLGLAYPGNVQAYTGNDPRANTAQKVYNPIFTNMYQRGYIPPLFSIALDRNTKGGHLAFGGLPPVNHTQGFASSPLQMLTTSSNNPAQNSSGYTLYTITTEGFTYAKSDSSHWSNSHDAYAKPTDPSQVQMIVDSGTTVTSLPSKAAAAVNNLFNPKPFYKDDSGFYVIPCDAKAPEFGVKIGMETFFINAKDMVINTGGQCISGVAATADGGINVLGHSFLKNVVAVFDVGANMMRFAARENY